MGDSSFEFLGWWEKKKQEKKIASKSIAKWKTRGHTLDERIPPRNRTLCTNR